jgi:Phytanoyl-CoA dioxygenase (PhyH)
MAAADKRDGERPGKALTSRPSRPIAAVDREHFDAHGYVVVRQIVPVSLCTRLVSVIEERFDIRRDDPSTWYGSDPGLLDIVPLWGHQAQWDIRQLPALHEVWACLWRTEALLVSLDRCRFMPPWRPGCPEALPIHWDHDPHDSTRRMIQGVIALTDTDVGQGGFRCVPGLYRDTASWPVDAATDYGWEPALGNHSIIEVPAATGDLIVWDSRLPHANSRNVSSKPRIAFYVMLDPTSAEERKIRVDCWRTGRCHPAW